jgi:hypothetical protein
MSKRVAIKNVELDQVQKEQAQTSTDCLGGRRTYLILGRFPGTIFGNSMNEWSPVRLGDSVSASTHESRRD